MRALHLDARIHLLTNLQHFVACSSKSNSDEGKRLQQQLLRFLPLLSTDRWLHLHDRSRARG